MPLTCERTETQCLIRLDGDCGVTSAAELKELLLEGLACGKDLRLDLEGATEIDVTTLQLLWAAGREATRTGFQFSSRVSKAVLSAARDAGFELFPGAAA